MREIKSFRDICEIQKELDGAIIQARNIDTSLIDNNKSMLAMIAECIEVCEASPTTYKIWKAGQEFSPSAMKIEVVDVLHFIAQLCHRNNKVEGANSDWEFYWNTLKGHRFKDLNSGLLQLINKITSGTIKWMIHDFVILCNTLGYVKEEIYITFAEKVAINYERTEKPVSEGGWN